MEVPEGYQIFMYTDRNLEPKRRAGTKILNVFSIQCVLSCFFVVVVVKFLEETGW